MYTFLNVTVCVVFEVQWNLGRCNCGLSSDGTVLVVIYND